MPTRAVALVTLILNRPFCIECIVMKTSLTPDGIEALLTTIGGALRVHRLANEPCSGCGKTRATVSVEGPLN